MKKLQLIKAMAQFLYIVPLKQGLKLSGSGSVEVVGIVFIHSSIKTRIETPEENLLHCSSLSVFIHSSIKTRIETLVTTGMSDTTVSFYT